MNGTEAKTFVLIPIEEWQIIKDTQHQILDWMKQQKGQNEVLEHPRGTHITAVEFMQAVRIGRSKFDELVAGGKIATVKKKRKIYVPVTEIERYFSDPTIE